MTHWGIDESSREFRDAANRIVAVLRSRRAPFWEKELKAAAAVTSIGVFFRYLSRDFGVMKICDHDTRPDDDDKLYFLSSAVIVADQSGNQAPLSSCYVYRP